MPFILQPMLEEDIDEVALVDERAMANYNMAKAMNVPGQRRSEMIGGWLREGWGKDPTKHWLKIVESESGEIAAAAMWGFTDEASKTEPEKDVPPPAEGVPVEEEKKEDEAETKKDDDDDENGPKKPSIMEWMRDSWVEFLASTVKDTPHAELNIMITDPKYQRRGAASMLMKWGCDRADRDNLVTILGATPDGFKLYERFDFETVKTEELDLSPWNIPETTVRRRMIRQPRPAQS